MQQYSEIQRRATVPDSIRTPGKDDAASHIQQVIDEGRWPMTPAELADEFDWSRSHYRNVLDQYFEPVGGVGDTRAGNGTKPRDKMKVKIGPEPRDDEEIQRTVRIEIPRNITNSVDYMRGYIDAKQEEYYR